MKVRIDRTEMRNDQHARAGQRTTPCSPREPGDRDMKQERHHPPVETGARASRGVAVGAPRGPGCGLPRAAAGRHQHATSTIQPHLSSASPCCTDCSPSRSWLSVSKPPNSYLRSTSVMDRIGATTVAVPHAPTSLKVLSSPHSSGRCSTGMPRSSAIAMSISFVMEGRIELVRGVTYFPSLSMPSRLETENSSTYLCSLESR
mmetsp:Transcript_16236/g.52056  ORF Transcript_16236/g.52056 Transcript_16236/m.52056 type:complete len:203 (+) Transcript_16236:74-682(+)